LALTTAVDIAKPICQAQRAATGVVAAILNSKRLLLSSCFEAYYFFGYMSLKCKVY
jgi:hypothetical protein